MQLRPSQGQEAQFMREHGLMAGKHYAFEEIVAILENYGMTELSFEPRQSYEQDEHQGRDNGRLDNFQLFSDGSGGRERTPLLQPSSLAYTYWFTETRLHYVDENGEKGCVDFDAADYTGVQMMMADNNEVAAIVFAARHKIYPGPSYTL